MIPPIACWELAQCAVVDVDISALEQLLLAHPELRAGNPPPYVPCGPRPAYSEGDAKSIITREHQFASFTEFVRYLEARRDKLSRISQFELAVDAVIEGDLSTLQTLLRENHELIHERSVRCHRATLLHYVAANGVEGFRQKTPKKAVKVVEALLDAGADVNAVADLYGKSTTLELVATSIHPWLAAVQFDLIDALIQAGATGGSGPQAGRLVLAALHNGRAEAAVFLAKRGAHLGLEAAAGIGYLDVVKDYFSQDGSLKASETSAQLPLAFRWACQYARTSIVDFLIEKVDAETRDAGLHWAVISGNVETLELFLKRQVPLETRNEWGGTALSGAVWCAEHNDCTDYAPVIQTLVAAGAQVNAEAGLNASVDRILHSSGLY